MDTEVSPARKVPVQAELSTEEAEGLKARFKTDDAGIALGKLVLMGAGLWFLSEAVKEEEVAEAL